MATTYTLISSNVLTGSAASVTFSSIPSTYTDLVIRLSARSDRAATSNNLTMNLNGATTNYSVTYLNQNGTTVASARSSGDTYVYLGAIQGSTTTANTFTVSEIYIPSYTVSQNKPFSSGTAYENNATSPYEQNANAHLWSSTAAITSITLKSGDGSFNFVSGSSFYLYGIKNS